MKYVIYIDVFWTINFFMDYMIMSTVAKFTKPRTTKVRKMFAAITGATLSCVVLMMKNEYVYMQKIITYLIIPVLMLFINFGKKFKKKTLFLIYGVTFLMSGIIEILYRNLLCFKNLSVRRFIIFSIASYIMVDVFFKKICKVNSKCGNEDDIYNVKIYAYGKCIEIRALYDSGNSLIEPISGKSVHVVEKEEVKRLLEGVEAYKIKLRMVPYRCIGRENGMIRAIFVSDIEIEFDEEVKNTGETYIGIYDGKLSGAKSYRMILNRSL